MVVSDSRPDENVMLLSGAADGMLIDQAAGSSPLVISDPAIHTPVALNAKKFLALQTALAERFS